jgi:hypothetical protein
MGLDHKAHFLYYECIRKGITMFKQSAEYRWFSAYQAWKRAQNPEWKAYWLKVMNHLQKEFN